MCFFLCCAWEFGLDREERFWARLASSGADSPPSAPPTLLRSVLRGPVGVLSLGGLVCFGVSALVRRVWRETLEHADVQPVYFATAAALGYLFVAVGLDRASGSIAAKWQQAERHGSRPQQRDPAGPQLTVAVPAGSRRWSPRPPPERSFFLFFSFLFFSFQNAPEVLT